MSERATPEDCQNFTVGGTYTVYVNDAGQLIEELPTGEKTVLATGCQSTSTVGKVTVTGVHRESGTLTCSGAARIETDDNYLVTAANLYNDTAYRDLIEAQRKYVEKMIADWSQEDGDSDE